MPGIGDKLGSFPNSQIKPRSPVRESETIDVPLAADTKIVVLPEDENRILAIIKNKANSAAEVEISYASGAVDAFTLLPGSATQVDGGGDDVYAEAIGGTATLEIDNRVG